MLKKNKNGFTLIELMVVIIIIGLLVAIAMPNFAAVQKRAKFASVKSNAKILQTIAEAYNIDNGFYPNKISQIESSSGYKIFKNPFTGDLGYHTQAEKGAWGTSEYGAVGSPGDLIGNYSDAYGSIGKVIYIGLNVENEATTQMLGTDGALTTASPPDTVNYMIVACDDKGKPLLKFLLSSGNPTPKGMNLLQANCWGC